MPTAELEVIQQTEWQIHHGGVSNPMGGIVGELTEVEVNGTTAFVRENIRYNSFLVSSGQRLAMKTRGQLPKDAVQVLELAAPAELWDEIASVVRAVDAMTQAQPREVVRNQRFTLRWAEQHFKHSSLVLKPKKPFILQIEPLII